MGTSCCGCMPRRRRQRFTVEIEESPPPPPSPSPPPYVDHDIDVKSLERTLINGDIWVNDLCPARYALAKRYFANLQLKDILPEDDEILDELHIGCNSPQEFLQLRAFIRTVLRPAINLLASQ